MFHINMIPAENIISRIVKIYHMNNEYGRLVGDGDTCDLSGPAAASNGAAQYKVVAAGGCRSV